jgi:hypothetical protein
VEAFETLRSLSEVAIALTGFTGIIAVLGHRAEGLWGPLEWLRLACDLPEGCVRAGIPRGVRRSAGCEQLCVARPRITETNAVDPLSFSTSLLD